MSHGAGVGWVRVMPGSKGGWYGHSPFCFLLLWMQWVLCHQKFYPEYLFPPVFQQCEYEGEGKCLLWGRICLVWPKFVSKEFQNFNPAGIPIGICWDGKDWECGQKDCPGISFLSFPTATGWGSVSQAKVLSLEKVCENALAFGKGGEHQHTLRKL